MWLFKEISFIVGVFTLWTQAQEILEEDVKFASYTNRYFLYNANTYRKNPVPFTRENVTISHNYNDMPTINPNIQFFTSSISPYLQTVIIVHGKDGSSTDSFTTEVTEAFLRYADEHRSVVNVIVVDWEQSARLPYALLNLTVPLVAADIVQVIRQIASDTYTTFQPIHLVGFDLGAHIVGLVGRDLDFEVDRITALDPTGLFWNERSQRLRKTDARYVEVIHTSFSGIDALGTIDSLGDIDIYIDMECYSSICTDKLSKHNRSWEVFAATLTYTKKTFYAKRCNSIEELQTSCNGVSIDVGGTKLNKFGRGVNHATIMPYYPYF